MDVSDKTVKNTAKQWLVEVTTQIHAVHFPTVTFLENVLPFLKEGNQPHRGLH